MLPALRAMEAYFDVRGLSLAARGRAPPAGAPQNGGAGYAAYVSPGSGLADGGVHASNWYDVINFGHLDAFIAVHGAWAVDCLAQLYAAAGDTAGATRLAATAAAARDDFNALFWVPGEARYADWIDTGGRGRAYFYVSRRPRQPRPHSHPRARALPAAARATPRPRTNTQPNPTPSACRST